MLWNEHIIPAWGLGAMHSNMACLGQMGKVQVNTDSRVSVMPAVALVGVLTLSINPALAIEPANVKAGPVYIAPTLDLAVRYVDNLLRSEKDEKSTWITEIAPKVQAWIQDGNNTYVASYKLVDSRYASSHDDDFIDHLVNLDIHHEFNNRNMVNIFGEYYDGHEERGTGLSEGLIAQLIDEPVEYERVTAGGDYTYGNRNSRGRIQLAARTDRYDYQNFRDFTRYRDYDADTYGATFFWKVGNKTDALFEVRAIDTEYSRTDPEQVAGSWDSEEMNYMVGLAWDATAKTTGSVRVGMYDREYDSRARTDDDGFHWEADLTWKPRTYSNIILETRRRSQETNGLGDYINTQEYALAWEHKWSLRANTHFGILLAEDDYSGAKREDDRYEVEASYRHEVQRWFDLSIGYRFEDRDSNVPTLDYQQNLFFVEAYLSL